MRPTSLQLFLFSYQLLNVNSVNDAPLTANGLYAVYSLNNYA